MGLKQTSADIVVIGAGSAGSVVAARATENPALQVLLLEAGPDYPPGDEPADLADGRWNSMDDHDWGFRHSPGNGQRVFPFPRGKVVGGSSAVNTCIALRGQPFDYDEWAALGLPEWSFERCLPAFKRIETDLDFTDEWHGQVGPIPVRRHSPAELVPWQAGFLEACGALGFEACADHNNPTSTGFGPHAMNKIDGRRQSAAECYLSAKVRARPNLSVSGGVLVRRILFNNNRVEGVEVEVAGQVQCIRTEQVVLCAGAIQSPGILLRSGVGPAADLARLQVSTVARVEGVGRSLLDHPGAVIVLAPRPGVSSIHHPLIQTTLRFTSQGSECPNDMQLQPGSLITLPLARIPAVTLMVCVGKPRGTGTLTFRSADAQVSPKIESRLLEHPADRARVAEALQLAWLTASTPVLSDMASFLWPSERVLRDKQDLLRWLPASTGSGYHPCGTIPMGPDADPDACVDQYGRLRGVDGVVVADASIMPTIPSSNTNFPTLMIGERVGEWLRDGAL